MGKFDDLFSDIPKKDFSAAFEDIPKTQTQDFSQVFADIPAKKMTQAEKDKQYIDSKRAGIKAITETPGYVPTGAERELTDEEILQQRSASDLIMRPMEFALSPLIGAYEGVAAGMMEKNKQKGFLPDTDEMVNQLSAMGNAFIRPFNEWARPLGTERENIPEMSTAAGIKNPVAALLFNFAMDPSNLIVSNTILNIVRKGRGFAELQEAKKAIAGVKNIADIMPERALTPTFAGKAGTAVSTKRFAPETIEIATGTRKNLPALRFEEPRPRDITKFDVNAGLKQPFKTEQIVGKTAVEKATGRKMQVESAVGIQTGEKVFRLKDGEKVVVEVAVKPNPASSTLHLDWVNIDKAGIDVSKRREARIGTPKEHIPGAYEEIHGALETYAQNNGYKVIGTNEAAGGSGRLRKMGFQTIPDEDVGKVPYTMVKRVGQNIPFNAPDFVQDYKKLIPQVNVGHFNAEKAYELSQYADRRGLFFDITRDNKYVFFDKYGKEIKKFDHIGDAENFVKNIELNKSTYWGFKQNEFKRAETLYNDVSAETNSRAFQELMKSNYPVNAGVGRKEVIKPTLQISTKSPKEKVLNSMKTGDPILDNAAKVANDTVELFDLGTGEIVGVGKGRIPIRESYVEKLKAIKDAPRDFYYNILTGKGWIMPALQFFERHGIDAKEMFYRRFKVAELRETTEVNNLKKQVNEVLGTMSKKERKQLGNFYISLDENGAATLQAMKLAAPTWEQLNAKQQNAFNFMKEHFDDFFGRINRAREFAGKDPITYRENYFSFFRNFDELQRMGYIYDQSKDVLEHVMDYIKKNDTPFRHAIERKGGVIELDNDVLDVFNRYSRNAIHYIHTSPAIAISRALLDDIRIGEKAFSVKDKAPAFYRWTNRWLDDIAGRQGHDLPLWVERFMNKMNKNVVASFLSGSIRSAIIQPTALVASWTELGTKYFMQGLGDWVTSHGDIMKKSNLSTREFEQGLSEMFRIVREPGYGVKLLENVFGFQSKSLRNVSRGYHGSKDVLTAAGGKLLGFLDMMSAQITWAGAYKKAKNNLKMAEQEAINFANDFVVRTQGSGKLSDLPEAQRTAVGKTLFTLQTFVINNWSWMMKDVFGINNPNMKSPDRLLKPLKLMLGMAATNLIFEDVMGSYSPFPSPIKAYMEEMEKSGSVPNAAFKVGKEVAELVPGFGGAIRYGSHVAGPLMQVLGSASASVSGKPEYMSGLEILATLQGIPGTRQISKIGKGIKQEAPFLETILGVKKSRKE